jgi:hypothetical protein
MYLKILNFHGHFNSKITNTLQQESTKIGLYYLFWHFSAKCRNVTPVFRSLLDLVFEVLLFEVFLWNVTPANNEGRLYIATTKSNKSNKTRHENKSISQWLKANRSQWNVKQHFWNTCVSGPGKVLFALIEACVEFFLS